MKVVKTGTVTKPPAMSDWTASVTCEKKDKPDTNGCGAILEVKATDLIMMYWKGSHFDHHYAAVKCLCCNKYNKAKELPYALWEKFNTAERRAKAIFDGFSDRS